MSVRDIYLTNSVSHVCHTVIKKLIALNDLIHSQISDGSMCHRDVSQTLIFFLKKKLKSFFVVEKTHFISDKQTDIKIQVLVIECPNQKLAHYFSLITNLKVFI